MKYRCNHCDITFESEKKDKVRCPECMSIHNVEPDKKGSEGPKPRNRFFWPAVIVLVLVAATVIFLGVKKQQQPASDAADMNPGDVKAQIEALGIEMDDAIVPFERTDQISKWATEAGKGKSGIDAVKSIFEGLLQLKKNGKWLAFSQVEARPASPLTADEILSKLKSDSPVELTSYEISCLLLAAVQSVETENVHMVEILNYKKEKAPADPQAIYSRYAIWADQKVFDVYAGREEPSQDVNMVRLNAKAAAAPFYAHRSLSHFAKLNLSDALRDNQTAVELDPQNATFKIHRGKIFLGSSAIQEAVAEFEKAKKIRDWGVTRVVLAQIHMMTQSNLNEVEADIRSAISEFPDYHQAHALLGAMYMMSGDAESAEQQLAIAEKIAPASPEVAASYAQLYAMKGETDQAILSAQKAVRLSKENFQSLLILAQVYRATARFDESRETIAKAIEKAPSDAVKEELRQAFQLTDDDEIETTAEDTETTGDVASGNNDLKLDLPSGSPAGELKLNLQNDPGSLGGGKLRLGGTARPGLGGDLKLEVNQ